ncbi:hypothetical protein F4808DRAFT_438557 [Astrocystis sublimbata]|nr:hypothetical protein F4808DRAFT_438557 [Astrocystis sublimbata]
MSFRQRRPPTPDAEERSPRQRIQVENIPRHAIQRYLRELMASPSRRIQIQPPAVVREPQRAIFRPRSTESMTSVSSSTSTSSESSSTSTGSESSSTSTSSVLSSASTSSGSSSTSSRRRSRDPTSYLKYLVRGFIKEYRTQRRNSSTRAEEIKVPDGNFVPSPMTTFLIDMPTDLVCQICQQTPLRLAVTAEPHAGKTALLACGHIFCHGCIDLWLSRSRACPCCRADMTHPDPNCGHLVEPRLIAADTIASIPCTIPNGGTIAEKCWKCTERFTRQKSRDTMLDFARLIVRARFLVEETGTQDALDSLHVIQEQVQKAFEETPKSDFFELARRQLREW